MSVSTTFDLRCGGTRHRSGLRHRRTEGCRHSWRQESLPFSPIFLPTSAREVVDVTDKIVLPD